MLLVISTALVGAHKYSNSNSPRKCCRVECILVVGTSEGTVKEWKERQKSDTWAKKVTKGAKANTPRHESNRWTIQVNRQSVRDWRRSSRRPRRGRTVQLCRCSSTSSTSSTRRCSYLDTATGSSSLTHYWCKSELKRKSEKLQACAHRTNAWHELGDRYDTGAIQRDRQIDRRLTTAAAAKKDYAASHRYSSSSPRRCS